MSQKSMTWVAAGCAAALALAACHSAGVVAEKPASDEMSPPPVMSAPEAVMDGSVAVTATRTGEEAAEPGIAPEPKKTPPPQAGLLTAGDYDDVLNPDLYKIYLDKTLQGDLAGYDMPYVDANRRIAIRVTDRLGKPVPLAKIEVASADSEAGFPVFTGANGLAYIYPEFDGLAGGMTVSASLGGKALDSATLTEAQVESGGELVLEMGGDRATAKKLDLLLTIDATGSMGDEMAYLKQELVGILDRVGSANPGIDIHVGLIVYRDKGDEYVIRDFPFTDDIALLKTQLSDQGAAGGGDIEEAMQVAMAKSLDYAWREDAVKVNLLLADAPPHDGDLAATWDSAKASRSRGIHVVPVAASGVEKRAEFLMRAMAQLTGGRYLFLTDDSGIGNAHAEPTVDCYVVTRLDSLVSRVLTSLIKGERVEPEGDEVIRAVGNYRGGVCKIEPAADDLKGGKDAQ